ncbi:hypothetical protein [Aidingimonas lacisalsi]|uniref:hypothetical protein n=1 Tax=Aidingimonas lacisalsi TaxID=2604086 RepID=UPI0011D21355|nr:hypothetical protein [Aidingimonas lacisalsi]
MSFLLNIEEKILSGMKSACDDTFFFLEDESQKIAAEYLLTVNVAKKLAELNSGIGYPYKIYLERKTKLVATDCVPLMAREHSTNFLGYKRVLRKRHNTERNGKVDICLYRDSGGMSGVPVCVIELKGFDPSRQNVLKDLRRNSEFFKISCRTGVSQIQYACFAAMHSFPKSLTQEQRYQDLEKLKQKYEKWQEEVGLPHGLRFWVKVKTMSQAVETTLLDENDPDSLTLDGNHHFAGVTVSYAREI